MLLSVLPVRTISEMHSPVNKNLSLKPREIGHLDNATLRNNSILKTSFQNPNKEAWVWLPWVKKPSPAKNLNTSAIMLSCPHASQVSGHEFTHAVQAHIFNLSFRPIPKEQSATEEEWRNPENACPTMLLQGILSKYFLFWLRPRDDLLAR